MGMVTTSAVFDAAQASPDEVELAGMLDTGFGHSQPGM
jgi:hypothetical protein